jgi:acetyl esterase/lipase
MIAVFTFASAGVAQGLLKMPVVYTVPGMDAVQVTRGLVYSTDGDVSLQMDVYRPPNLQKNERRPAVLFLHGGADISKPPAPTEWGVYQSYGRLMGASGLIGVTFNQRMGSGLEKGFADVRAAIEYVRSHAAELHVDPDRLCLSAYSAGGPLLAIAVGDPQPYIRCLVGFYAVLDIGPPITPERAPYSPIEQLKLHADKLPPIFLARAGKDSQGLNGTIDRFVTEAASRNVAIEFHNIRGAPHAFDIQTPSAEVRSVIARVIAFLKASLEH